MKEWSAARHEAVATVRKKREGRTALSPQWGPTLGLPLKPSCPVRPRTSSRDHVLRERPRLQVGRDVGTADVGLSQTLDRDERGCLAKRGRARLRLPSASRAHPSPSFRETNPQTKRDPRPKN